MHEPGWEEGVWVWTHFRLSLKLLGGTEGALQDAGKGPKSWGKTLRWQICSDYVVFALV